MMDWATASTELAKPLDGRTVKERTMAGRKMSYVEGWHVIAEANRIFGFNGWTRETVEMRETSRDLVALKNDRGDYQQWRVSYLAKVRVTVDGIAREGTGYGSGMGKPEALGDAIESAAKEAETDAMKRALMTFGNPFGLALYDKTQENVDFGEKEKPQTDKPLGNRFAELKESLHKIEDHTSLSTWIEQVKTAVQSNMVSTSERAMLANQLEARRSFLAQSPAKAA